MAFQQRKRNCKELTSPHPLPKKQKLEWQIWADRFNAVLSKLEEEASDRSRQQHVQNPPTSKPSSNITIPLMRHQKEWLNWALNQEVCDIKGGILADEMGMGKTLEAIALVITSRDLSKRTISHESSSTSPVTKSTLVICPVPAFFQWRNEIRKCTKEGTASVLIYHGPKRDEQCNFGKYDFVLTSLETLRHDFEKHMMPPKKKCMYCGSGFCSEEKLQTHQRNDCDQFASKTIQKQHKVRPTFYDGMSPLHLVKWKRIIIDEVIFVLMLFW